MSVRYFVGQVARFFELALNRVRFIPLSRFRIRLPTRIPVRLPVQRIPPAAVRTAGRTNFWRTLLQRNRHVFSRLGAAGVFDHRHLRPRHALLSSRALLLLMASNENYLKSQQIVENIRRMHEEISISKTDRYPLMLEGYDVNDVLNAGCNGIVYSARVSVNNRRTEDRNYSRKQYPLAIKVCYNYCYPNVTSLIRELWQELVPSTGDSNLPVTCGQQTSRQHQNIVKIHAAFVDAMRLLPQMEQLCPAVLPPTLHPQGEGQLQTLYIVMPRYRMTLREYMLLFKVPLRRAQLLLAQLLEAVRFLNEERIAHRDLKSNNILLEFERDDEDPLLVVCDFGCCLADDGFQIPYFDENGDLGGNQALRPPEVSAAVPALFRFVDFSKADLWAAGSIGYEMYLGFNPFYGRLHSQTYLEEHLPRLPQSAPTAIDRLLSRIMQRNPKLRPSPSLAATVAGFSLFTNGEILESIGSEARRKVTEVQQPTIDFSQVYAAIGGCLMLYAAEASIGFARQVISRAEHMLRMTLLQRVDGSELLEAIFYFHRADTAVESRSPSTVAVDGLDSPQFYLASSNIE